MARSLRWLEWLYCAALCGCIADPPPAPDELEPEVAEPAPEEPEPNPTEPEPNPTEPEPVPPTAEPMPPLEPPEPMPPPPDPNPGPPAFPEPERHRPVENACDNERPPGIENGDPDEECENDADCVDGRNGRCVHGRFAFCTYDECFFDDECANEMGGGVCECEGSWLGNANACYSGDCQVNADCATGYCSPSFGGCGHYSGFIAYYCHTFDDVCISDSDCNSGRGEYCAFMPQLGHWACSNSECDGK